MNPIRVGLAICVLAAGCAAKAPPKPAPEPKREPSGIGEAELGVPLYPGSSDSPSSGSKVEYGTKIVSSVRQTQDKPELALAFYRQKLGKETDLLVQPNITVARWMRQSQVVELLATNNPRMQNTITVNVRTPSPSK